jgi:hypothetical protein
MVDRPFPADPAWLERIRELYGACDLVPMTARGERGLACQMHIEPDSLQHLRRLSPAFGRLLQEALEPMLEEPPSPTLALRWDEERRAWASEMVVSHGLPTAIREVFEHTGYGCLAAESTRGIVHVCHAADEDITNFVDKPMQAHWQLVEMPTAPLIKLELLIYDHFVNPYCFESFLNVADPKQRAVLTELASQEELYLAFYGNDLAYRYTSVLSHSEQQWQQLDDIIASAELYWQRLPDEKRDFDQAKAVYMLLSA